MYLANVYTITNHPNMYGVVANKVYATAYGIYATYIGGLRQTGTDVSYFNGLTKHKVRRYGKDKPSEASA